MAIKLPVQAVPDGRSFDRTAEQAEKRFAQAGKDSGQAFTRGLDGALEKADPKGVDKWVKAYDKLADATDRIRVEEAKLKALKESNASDARLIAQSAALEKARRAESRATRDAAIAYKELEDSAKSSGAALAKMRDAARVKLGPAGEDAANNFLSGLSGASALTRIASTAGPIGLAFAATGTLGLIAGRMVGAQFGAGLESLNIKDTFAARIGVDSSSMARYGQAAGKAFSDNWGASVQDNLKVIQFAIQGGLINPEATEAQIQELVAQIQTVSGLIGEDSQAIARGVRNFVKTGLVDSTTEALDLVVAASQKGLNISGDLLDTLEEYGTKFRDVGLSGEDALGLINQLWTAGIRNTDVAADALKEFAITVVDGSKTTKQAFAALGFDADEMANRFAAGGPTARQSLGEVLTALNGIHDPLQQELIGTALFKTKWEDAGDAIKGADLGTAATQLGEVEGATKRASDKVSEHASSWDSLGKKIDQTFLSLKEWLADSAIGRFFNKQLPDFLGGFLDSPTGATGYTATYPGRQSTPVTPSPGGGITSPPTGAIQGNGTFLDSILNGIPGVAAPPGLAGPGTAGGPPSTRVDPVPMTTSGSGAGGSQSGITLPYPAEYGQPPLPGESDQQYQARMENIMAEYTINQARARLNQLESDRNADANAVVAARNAVVDAEIRQHQTEQRYLESTRQQASSPGVLYSAGYGQGPRPGQSASQYSAESSFYETQQKAAEASSKYQQLLESGTATTTELAAAYNEAMKAARDQNEAMLRLSESATKTTEKLGDVGAQLDADFGISNGLPGIAENLTRFIANLTFAPVLGALKGVESSGGYDQGKMGAGLVGLFSAGMNGPGVDQTAGDAQIYGSPRIVRGGTSTALALSSSAPGFSDAALLASIPRGGRYDSSGDLLKGLADCTSGIEDLVNLMDGRPTEGRSMSTGNADEWLRSRGFLPTNVPMPGTFQVGFNSHHMEGTLPGGTKVNYGSDASVASGGTAGAVGAWDPGFTSHYYRPVGGSVQGAAGLSNLPIPLPVTIVGGALGQGGLLSVLGSGGGSYAPLTPDQLTNPSLTTPVPSGAAVGSTVGGMSPGPVPGGGFSVGGGAGGSLLQGGIAAAGMALDAMAPGAGTAASIAANIGIQEVNRAVEQAGKYAGIGVGGLQETFSLSDPSQSWFGRIAGAVAGAKPALPNMAGGSAAAPGNGQAHGTANGAAPGPGVVVNYTNNQATEDRAGKDLTNHLLAMNSAP